MVRRSAWVIFTSFAILLSGCGEGKVDDADKEALRTAGYEEGAAADLSILNLTEEEVAQLEIAKRGGLDGAAAKEIVELMHDKDLKFDIGMEMQTLSLAGFSATALVELVKMGAVRVWETDLRVMKHAGIGEPTIVRIAERKFVDEKDDLLPGRDYTVLKAAGMSDAGIESFVKNGGTVLQLQKVELAIRMGTSEQAALKEVGL
ncbi:MAG: hypothetical protein J4G05_03190 [Chlorobi bacterium]|nr:hypothetical protein [Chlorobiota bacterium]